MSEPDYANDPNVVEVVAFTKWMETAMPNQSVALDADEWRRMWRTVDETTKERHRENAQNEMRDFAKHRLG
jgi:hypothetical protein